MDFKGKSAAIEFDESIISAQEAARAMSITPHMMGRDMQYGGILVLSVPGVNEEATGKQAAAALRKVEGVRDVTLFPKQQAVGIEFTGKGKVTSKQLTDTLQRLSTGLKINSGGDDPAGLIASEGLRSEIAGINQAIDNASRATNVISTAEGALNVMPIDDDMNHDMGAAA